MAMDFGLLTKGKSDPYCDVELFPQRWQVGALANPTLTLAPSTITPVPNRHLSQTDTCHEQTPVTNGHLSQTDTCHEQTSVTNGHLSQIDTCHERTNE